MEISEISVANIGLKAADPSYEDYWEVGDKLKEAFSKLGFVYIRDHGIDDVIIQKYEYKKMFVFYK
jgi:isopenicillin N synthase-like dioxygenase